MASPTTPYHGKYGSVCISYDNGFVPAGLIDSLFTRVNDAIWGDIATGPVGTVSIFEVQITSNDPDMFIWRKDYGIWSAALPLAVTPTILSDGVTIKWEGIINHAAEDAWVLGNHHVVPCTVSGNSKQITNPEWALCNIGTSGSRALFYDTAAGYPHTVNWNTGIAYYHINPTDLVTTNAVGTYISKTALARVAYVTDWSLSVSLDMADSSYMGIHWKNSTPGQAGSSGNLSCFFLSADNLFTTIRKDILPFYNTQKFYHLSLYNYDPNQDKTGDHFMTWAIISSSGVSASVGDVVKETVDFTGEGIPAFRSSI